MTKVTSKLQVTIPKAIADQYGIEPGDEIEFRPAGESIRVSMAKRPKGRELGIEERLRLFDAAMERQRRREEGMKLPPEAPSERDWRRQDLYSRGKSR